PLYDLVIPAVDKSANQLKGEEAASAASGLIPRLWVPRRDRQTTGPIHPFLLTTTRCINKDTNMIPCQNTRFTKDIPLHPGYLAGTTAKDDGSRQLARISTGDASQISPKSRRPAVNRLGRVTSRNRANQTGSWPGDSSGPQPLKVAFRWRRRWNPKPAAPEEIPKSNSETVRLFPVSGKRRMWAPPTSKQAQPIKNPLLSLHQSDYGSEHLLGKCSEERTVLALLHD
ncbi:hypothetical protein CIHG_01514, partial [Coccidioides immitis H538.4]